MSPRLPSKGNGRGAEADGGWGWCVVAASFVAHTIAGGISYSGGVWLMILRRYFERSRRDTAFVGAILLAMSCVGGVVSTYVTYKFSYRVSMIMGGLLSCIGFTLSVFCSDLHELFLCIGALVGLGLGMALTPSVMAIESYFTDGSQRRLAAGFASTGTSLGVAIFPLLLYHMEDFYAWKGVSFLLVAVCANLIMCGATLLPKDEECRNEKPRRWKKILKVFEPTLFRSAAFCVLLVCNILWSAGAIMVLFQLPEYAMSTGISMDDSILLLAIVGGTSLISRVIFQLFSHSAKLDSASNCLCSAGLAAILTGLFPEFFLHRAGEISYAIIFGLHAGFWSTFVGAISEELITGELLAYGRGFLTLSVGVGLLIGPVGSAWLLDSGVDFEVVFYLAGTLMLVSSVMMLSVSIKKCYYRPAFDVGATDSSSSSLSNGSQLSSADSPITSDEQLVVSRLPTAV